MTDRYLVLLSRNTPALGGFSYANLDRAMLSLLNIRQRWPRAELRVIPAKPSGGKPPSPKARRAK